MTMGKNVVSIGDSAFYYCLNLVSISIPNNTVSIGNNAFTNCANLTSFMIPNSVTSIGVSAFAFCSLGNSLFYKYQMWLCQI